MKNNYANTFFPPLTTDDGSIITYFRGKTELFARPDRMPSVKFKVKRVQKILFTLDTQKAVGLEQIPAIFLKKHTPDLASFH